MQTRSTDNSPCTADVGTSLAHNPVQEAEVLQQFRIVFNAVKSHWQQVERKAGIGGAQVWALSVIQAQPGIGVNGLAAALHIKQPTASYLVRCLSQQGLVESRRDGADRRGVQLHIKAEGCKVLDRTPGPFTGVLPQALAQMSGESLGRLHDDLQQLIQLLKSDPAAANTPMAGL